MAFSPLVPSGVLAPAAVSWPLRVAILELLFDPFEATFSCQPVDFLLIGRKSRFQTELFTLLLTSKGPYTFTVRRELNEVD